jgi:hypothetical protein
MLGINSKHFDWWCLLEFVSENIIKSCIYFLY